MAEVTPKPSKKLLDLKRQKKIQKYMWIPEVLARMMIKRLPTNTTVSFDDLKQAGLEELIRQMNRIYTDDTLIERLWDPKKKDLTVGPFFLKGINSPVLRKTDSGSIKFVKGRMLDIVRAEDPAPPAIRAELKKITAFKNKYYSTLGRYPRQKVIMEKFDLTREKLDELLAYESFEESTSLIYKLRSFITT